MAWQRVGECPGTVKTTFTVNRDEFPELAQWLWEMPHRDASKKIRETLAVALGEQPATHPPRTATV
ncbi:MAG: hypothetical protein PHR35_21860, partial [Kiritimatiellae bacterium]|nr:hypothetical protein [Kiritimatiellia bacterium]